MVTDPTSKDLQERPVMIALHKPDNIDNEEFKPLCKLDADEYTGALTSAKYTKRLPAGIKKSSFFDLPGQERNPTLNFPAKNTFEQPLPYL
jgi:hypothetical protein